MEELVSCIICREEKNKTEMSDEHVIPDSLGGRYHIYNVCRDCNSFMGEKIDGPLVNHKLTQLYRLENKMRGKSGSIPNPFSDSKICDENSNVTTIVKVDQSTGAVYTEYHSKPKYTTSNEKGISRLEVSVDVNNKHETVDSAIKKFLHRNNIPRSAATIREEKIEEVSGHIDFKLELESSKFQIGLLKIAYEFATDVVPSYFLDEEAVQISKILRDADYASVERYFIPTPSFLDIYQSLNISNTVHALLLFESDQGLFCIVKLGNIFNTTIQLSKNNNFFNIGDFGWIVINCPMSREFKKMKLRDFVRGVLISKLLC